MQETWNSVPTLIVVPARAENAEEIEPILQTLVSVTATAPGTMVLVVDDRSPAAQAQLIEAVATELDCAYVLQQDGEGRRPPSTSACPSRSSTAWTSASSPPAWSSSPPAGSTACAPARAPTAHPPPSPAAPSSSRRHDPPRRLLLLALPPRLARAPAQRARGRARRPRRRCCARSAPSCSSCATSGSRRSATTTSCSTAPHAALDYCHPRQPRPAASASSSRRCAPAPWRARRRARRGQPCEQRLRLKHTGVNF